MDAKTLREYSACDPSHWKGQVFRWDAIIEQRYAKALQRAAIRLKQNKLREERNERHRQQRVSRGEA